MPFDDLRAYLRRLEEDGELVHVSQEVDWDQEAGAIVRRSNELGLQAVVMDKIKDHPNWRLSGALMSTVRRVAIAMDMPPDTRPGKLMAEFLERTENPIKPVLVESGPCKENILLGDQADLFALPAPMVHQGDGGRYACTWHINVTKDLDSDWVNWGMYRGMILDRKSLGLLVQPNQHVGQMFYPKYEARGIPMEMSIAIGVDPMATFCATTFFPRMVNEAEMTGAMRGKPVELVQCETVDLQVPATAEVVIEGKVWPGERRDEGPFGEYTGYRAADRSPRPVMQVTAITHRNNPIFTMSSMGVPVDDCHATMSITKAAQIERELRSRGLPITGVWVPPESSLFMTVVATKVPYGNIAAVIAHNVFGSSTGVYSPILIVVQDDVDPSNWSQVVHTLSTRLHPYRGVNKFEHDAAHVLDPRNPLKERRLGLGSKVYFDCTWPVDWDRDEVPERITFAEAYSQETQEKVLRNWAAYGFAAQ